MDVQFVQSALATNRPFVVKTASGKCYAVPHRDFLSFSGKRTALIISYVEDEKERVAYVPLLTITSIEADSVEATD